jgi:hypothetical protein
VLRLAGLLLACEAILTVARLSRAITMLAAHDPVVLAILVLRAAIAALQFTASAMLFRRADAAERFARAAWGTSAILFVFEIGFGLAPSSVFPSHRWPIVAAYGAYVLAVIVGLHQAARRLR